METPKQALSSGTIYKPILVVSQCLGFEPCRYNGQRLTETFVEELKPYVRFVPVCPEVAIGLGVPRDPVRLVRGAKGSFLYQPATDKDVTDAMMEFCRAFFRDLGEVDGFLLKHRSPSCGPSSVKVYHTKEKGAGSSKGMGFFAEQISLRFPGYPSEDEGRLKDFSIREHFLTSLFTLTEFREAKQQDAIQSLIRFHSRSKLLLMAYNQSKMRALGRIVADHKKGAVQPLFEAYETLLRQTFSKPPRSGSMVNALMHAFGGVSENLSSQEKEFFLNKIEEYRDERIPLSALVGLVQAWAVRFENDYLLDQSLLRPYPIEMVSVRDSGKGTRK